MISKLRHAYLSWLTRHVLRSIQKKLDRAIRHIAKSRGMSVEEMWAELERNGGKGA